MIQIRMAESSDLPEILNVLKASLGDVHGRRNPEFWKWKHSDNPFGPSVILLAFSEKNLVGVRAMMRWEFRLGDTVIPAWRAVDTSVHPDYQRQGIFSKLNQEMISHLATLGPALIFNTPNSKSAQGYLKQGWQQAGKVGAAIKPNFAGLLANRIRTAQVRHELFIYTTPSLKVVQATNQLFKNQLLTNWNMERLNWRYAQAPGLDYNSFHSDNGSLIFRMVRRGKLMELRVVELFAEHTNIKNDFKNLIGSFSPDFISLLLDGQGQIKKFLPSGFITVGSGAPQVVCRTLDGADFSAPFKDERHRYFSAGSMELF